MRRIPWLLPVLALALVLLLVGEASACPNCKEALASQTGDAARLKDGYFYSILFMMGMPFLLLGTGALMVVRAAKRGALPEL
jgi:heme/copper-type cytochrome/quinol oxidase subunit 2